MKIKKDELIYALEKVKPGLAKQEVIEQTTSFAFLNGKIITYNDRISVSHPINLDINGAVNATELYKLLGKIKKDEIDLTIQQNEIILKAGRSKAGFRLQNEIKLPLNEINIKEWKKAPPDLKHAMCFTMFSCSTYMMTPILTCVSVNTEKQTVESSDNTRITQYKIKNKIPVPSFLIPAKSVKELVDYDFTHMALNNGWIHFKTNEETIFSCRIFEDEYVDVDDYINSVTGHRIKIPSGIQDILDRALVFVNDQNDKLITVKLENKKISIKAINANQWFEETTKVNYNDKPIEFQVNPIMLKDIINKTNNFIIGKNLLKFKNDEWSHIVAYK